MLISVLRLGTNLSPPPSPSASPAPGKISNQKKKNDATTPRDAAPNAKNAHASAPATKPLFPAAGNEGSAFRSPAEARMCESGDVTAPVIVPGTATHGDILCILASGNICEISLSALVT